MGAWRSAGWLFAHGWTIDDALALFFSGIVPTQEAAGVDPAAPIVEGYRVNPIVEGYRVKRVWIDDETGLDELKRAARFARDGQKK